MADVANDEQIRANGLIAPLDHPGIEGYQDVSFPLTFDGERPPVRRPPPAVGEHSSEILAELEGA